MLRIAMLLVLLLLVGGVLVMAPAMAQPADGAGAAAETSDLNWLDFFVVKGGYITYFLILLSIVAGALAIEHFYSIRRTNVVPPDVVAHIKQLIEEKKYLEAVRFTAEEPSMAGHVVNAGLLDAPNGYYAMERAVEESLEERSARLFRKIEFLNVIGNVSPMIGLFGTVYGMILLFAQIHAENQFPSPQIVADKISIALITTFWGLLVAIAALSCFAFLRNRIDVLTAECALTAEKLLAVFKSSAPAPSGGAPKQGS